VEAGGKISNAKAKRLRLRLRLRLSGWREKEKCQMPNKSLRTRTRGELPNDKGEKQVEAEVERVRWKAK